MNEPTSWQEKREWTERYAGLLFQVGTIIEDREVCNSDADLDRLWSYLYDEQSALYDRFGKLIDDIEGSLGLEADDERPAFGSSPTGFTRV